MTPVDTKNRRHRCQDETATAVNGRWLCVCLGGPYFTDLDELRRHQARMFQGRDQEPEKVENQ